MSAVMYSTVVAKVERVASKLWERLDPTAAGRLVVVVVETPEESPAGGTPTT